MNVRKSVLDEIDRLTAEQVLDPVVIRRRPRTLTLDVRIEEPSREAYYVREWARGVVVSPYTGFLERLEIVVTRHSFRFVFEGFPPHRETGEPTPVRLSESHSLLELFTRDPDRFLATALRNALHKATAHELDEGILINGARVFDPHKEGR